MYSKIKEMAQAALDLQNKDFMDETLRNIIAACDEVLPSDPMAINENGKVIQCEKYPIESYHVSMSIPFSENTVARQLKDPELLASAPSGFPSLGIAEHEATFNPLWPAAKDAMKYPGDVNEKLGIMDCQSLPVSAEMIADIQGSPSPVFPLPDATIAIDAAGSPAVDEVAQGVQDALVTSAITLPAAEQLSDGDPVTVDDGAAKKAAMAKSITKKGAAK